MPTNNVAPLEGLKVIEFSHMVMGPSAGLILADLGADVIKIEPVTGDKTRLLKGSGAGYFAMYNRNKRSVRLNLKSEQGLEVARELLATADVLIENFRPGTLDRLGLDYASLTKANPRLIYCSTHGFLSGPYENRTALDEVAQMMGGPRVHDRSARPTVARRLFGHRCDRRYVRRDWHSCRGRGATPHRQGQTDQELVV